MTVDPIVSERPSGPGLRLFDPIEKSYEDLHTPDPVESVPCSTDAFHFPVDVGVAIETDRVRTPYRTDVWIRRPDGELLADTSSPGTAVAPDGSYNVELSVTGVKVYLSVESPVEVTQLDDGTEIRFGGTTRVEVGVRSFHEQPAGTITVTDDPVDVMAGLSLFGSALKTESPERTFPTLRGHPPLLERGDAFEAPDGLAAPDTGIRIEVPATRSAVYPVASLAYFLGATVRPGDDPLLVVGDRRYPLDGPPGFPGTVRRVLEQTFLFDCATRTEGFYRVRLDERERLETALDEPMPFADLYDRPLAERVNRYLSVPYERIEDVMPTWPLTVDVEPTPENAAMLPFAADKLAVIRCDTARPALAMPSQPEPITDFYRTLPRRDGRPGRDAEDDGGVPTLADGGTTTHRHGRFEEALEVVRPPETDTLEHLWIAEGIPVGASKATPDVFHRQIGRSPDVKPAIGVVVVCNDPAMREEGVVGDIYGDREHVEVEVGIHHETTRDGLREILATETDFLHYVGHIDRRGIQCQDGHLDARDLETVGTDAFLLNGCRSYEQGRALVDAGAIAGIVTLDVVANDMATRTGLKVAQILSGGHSLSTSADLVSDDHSTGFQYTIIGDGTMRIIRVPHGTPLVWSILSTEPDSWKLEITGHPSNESDIGASFRPHTPDVDRRYINSGVIDSFTISSGQMSELLEGWPFPIWSNGELYLSTQTSMNELSV